MINEIIGYFDDFLKDEVNLNKSRVALLESKIDIITSYLKDKYVPYRTFETQGSYALKTIIKPVDADTGFDADVLIMIKGDEFDANTFVDYVNDIYEVFRADANYKDIVEKNNRCVTLDYAGDFHLDLVPCIRVANGENDYLYYICNSNDKCYELTDGDGYKKWLVEKNKKIGENHIRKVTRLLKYSRDHSKKFDIKSIILTTLIGAQVQDDDEYDDADFANLPTCLKTLVNRINDYLQQNEALPRIQNPILESENFADRWNQDGYSKFRKIFNDYNNFINDAYKAENHDECVKEWRKIFGDKFGKLNGDTSNNNSGGKITPAATASIPIVDAVKPYALSL